MPSELDRAIDRARRAGRPPARPTILEAPAEREERDDRKHADDRERPAAPARTRETPEKRQRPRETPERTREPRETRRA